MAGEEGWQFLRLLVCSPCPVYPPHGGASLRILRQLQLLSQRHQVTLVVMSRVDADSLQAIRQYCHEVHQVVPNCSPCFTPGQPRSVEHFWSSELQQALEKLARQSWDWVVCHFIFTARWSQYFQARRALEEHNVESHLYRQRAAQASSSVERAAWLAEALQLERFENEWWPRFDVRFAVSELNAQEIRRRCPEKPTVVIQNGCDSHLPMRSCQRAWQRLLFCGKMDYPPNADAVDFLLREVMVRVWQRAPQVQVLLAGAQAQELQLEPDERVQLVTNPPEMGSLAESCSALVVPLRWGSGTRIKVLEAMAWGLPVISTPIGYQGLELEEGEHLLRGDDAEQLAEHILTLLQDEERWQRLRNRARSRVEAENDWSRWFALQESELEKRLG